jgi:hypothetical protein
MISMPSGLAQNVVWSGIFLKNDKREAHYMTWQMRINVGQVEIRTLSSKQAKGVYG